VRIPGGSCEDFSVPRTGLIPMSAENLSFVLAWLRAKKIVLEFGNKNRDRSTEKYAVNNNNKRT
jgi:hypothetical protein